MLKSLAFVVCTLCGCASTAPVAITGKAGTDRRMIQGKASVRTLAQGNNAWLGILTLAPDLEVALHRDPTEEYIVIMDGGGTIWIEGEKYILAPGDTAFMPARAQVRFRNGARKTTAFQVFAGPRSAQKYKAWAVNPAKDD